MDELGWNSLEERRKYFRMCNMYKISNKLVPEYLSSLIPLRVGDRTRYNLRNKNNLSLVMANHVKTYNSFVPKSVRDWNNVGAIKKAKSLEGFKMWYKRDNFRKTNKLYNIDHNGGNVHHTRLRLGLSPLSDHLYTNNIIDDPLCKLCNLENETTAHYLLRCPHFARQRAAFLSGLLEIIDADYLNTLRDNDIVNLFLFGDEEFPYQANLMLNEISQTYIIDSERFN